MQRFRIVSFAVGAAWLAASAPPRAQTPALVAPGFHHVHLNSPNPEAAIAVYVRAHPSNTRATFGGITGFRTSNGVYFLFDKVAAPPPAAMPDRLSARNPQTAFWHFVFPVPNLRATLQRFHAEDPTFATRLFRLYTGPDASTVEMSGDTLPGFLTSQQIDEAKTKGVTPTGDGGYISWAGPDGAVMETAQGDERLSIFGMFQEQPYCAVLWYQRHLNAPVPTGRGSGVPPTPVTDDNCVVARSPVVSWPSTYKRGHVRVPNAMGVNFGDVFVRWYMNQEQTPLAPMRGGVVDHFALSVPELDPWIAKLRTDKVTFLAGPTPYRVGTSRAVMIEGPSREAIELIEVRPDASTRK